MKYLLIFLVFTLGACGQISKQYNQFFIEHASVESDLEFENCFKLNEGYLLVDKNSSLYYYDNSFKKERLVLDSAEGIKFDFIYSHKDSIICTKWLPNDSALYYYLDSNCHWILLHTPQFSYFYEDNDFVVHGCCAGEFGGAIFFNDKMSNATYSAPATCPVAVNMIHGEYYVTNSSTHKMAHAEVLKIKKPRELYELKHDSLKNICNWWYQLVSNENGYTELDKFSVGTEKILDTIGISTISSIKRADKLYFLCNDATKTFIGKVENKKLVMIDSISPVYLTHSLTKINKTKNGFICFYNIKQKRGINEKAYGFIELENDTIRVVEFK